MLPGVSYYEMILVGIVALLLYGKNLPEVAKKFGKKYTEFRRGMQGLQREFNSAMDDSTPSRPSPAPAATRRPDPVETRPEEFRAPRFEPPVAPPSES
ncbi:MAG: twin-arginine translocase TatA/TatE family subunit [Planctomycetaceae bacterium]|nr:twin-arginine translocase TatA/TatE family subunit [Planctomycetaceae bacterium]MCA9032468.1 twin-arginine translocase TatA/TatE family subunit [Planctomycetaceae bacterium]MCA9046417.1 twin-arginine translocase TatA/TatE family subunit [Planctomycetaceae bacterium]MCB9953678.1 twin-arginine translocase TatA/TatE family subunit [Planctomycetaceae bacterium]